MGALKTDLADAGQGALFGEKLLQAPGTAQGPKLAYLISRFPSVSHTFILREVRELRQQGFDIACASVNAPDREVEAMTEDEREEFRRAYYLKRHGLFGALMAHLLGLLQPAAYVRGLRKVLDFGGGDLKRLLFGFFYFTEALMLARWMHSGGYRHLHVHFGTAAANIALFLKALAPVTLSLTIHGPDEFYDVSAEKLVEKISAADFLVCIGHFARSQLMKLSPASQWPKFHICPLGVDVSRYTPAGEVQIPRPFTILCVGRLTPAKGQHILIEACAALRDWGRDFRLVLVGSGPDEAALRQAIEAHHLSAQVLMTGPLNQDQVRAWYGACDVFALPSFAEGIPVVLMEAMASGVPCVTTRITGIPELIRDGVDGFLTTPSDIQELADTLAMLMDDPVLRREIGASGRQRVSEAYELNTNVTRLAQVFRGRLGQGVQHA